MREKIRKALEEKRAEARRLYAVFDEARKAAADEGADITNPESEAFARLEEAHKAYAAVEQEARALEDRFVRILEIEGALEPKGDDLGHGSSTDARGRPSAADVFLGSEAYKELVRSGALDIDRARVNMTPIKALERAEFKTLITGASDTSGGAFVVEDRQAGYVDIPRRPLLVADLITVGDTDSDAVEYVELTSRTNAAAETPEATSTNDSAANAPESGLGFAVKVANVREITHYIPVTRRALADAGQLRTIIDQELRDGILERLDSQIVVGDGTGENLRGILNTPGLLSQLIGSDSLVDAIHKGITQVILQNYVPDAVLFHPSDWEAVRLSKDDNGQYLFGPPSQPGASTIWGYPVVVSQAVPAGTTLVGAFRRGATLWVRSGVTIAATDAHADWFIRRLVAVLASYRAAFAVQRPKAFCEISAS